LELEFESEDEAKAERHIVRKSRFAMRNWVVGFQQKEKMRKLAQIIIIHREKTPYLSPVNPDKFR